MKEFKGLKVPNAPKMETSPILDGSCHVGGGEYRRNIGCVECIFSTPNWKLRLEYYNHLKSNQMEFNKESQIEASVIIKKDKDGYFEIHCRNDVVFKDGGEDLALYNGKISSIIAVSNEFNDLKNNKMEFNKEQNVLTVDGKVYDVVERKAEYEKGKWYAYSFEDHVYIIKCKHADSMFRTGIVIGYNGIVDREFRFDPNDGKCSLRKATEQDFLSFGYRLLKTKQPWDGEMQEFLVKDLDAILGWDDANEVTFTVIVCAIPFGENSSWKYDRYLPATPENVEKMTEWMKGNLK